QALAKGCAGGGYVVFSPSRCGSSSIETGIRPRRGISRDALSRPRRIQMKKSLVIRNAFRQLRHGFNRPFMVMFETTLHCNMKCGYCAIWQNQQPEDRAMRERVLARMDEAADFGVFAWSFSGGEPLMNPNVPEYIDYASKT